MIKCFSNYFVMARQALLIPNSLCPTRILFVLKCSHGLSHNKCETFSRKSESQAERNKEEEMCCFRAISVKLPDWKKMVVQQNDLGRECSGSSCFRASPRVGTPEGVAGSLLSEGCLGRQDLPSRKV